MRLLKLNSEKVTWIVTCPKGAEELLANELSSLSATEISSSVGFVRADGGTQLGYKICLWSRLASRVLFPIHRFKETNAEEMYLEIRDIPWEDHIKIGSTICVDFDGKSKSIQNSLFGAQKVKDAIVDRLIIACNTRPDVDTKSPDIRINVKLKKGFFQVYLDFSGSSLHRRGYRVGQGTAPLKENLAALILNRSHWKKTADEGGFLIDPMCGSGTFLIEAAMIAANIAPGILRESYGFLEWKQYESNIWDGLLSDARSKRKVGLAELDIEIKGHDINPRIIEVAAKNIEKAGLDEYIKVSQRSIDSIAAPTVQKGLFITNPPYGERLGDKDNLNKLYKLTGEILKTKFKGWKAGIFSGNDESVRAIDLSPSKIYKLNNGTLSCKLLIFEHLISKSELIESRIARPAPEPQLNDSSSMILNRLIKNERRLSSWLKLNNINSYRLYDCDIPEFAAAVDIYGADILVQEYAAPKQIPISLATKRFQEIKAAVKVFSIRNGLQVFYRRRARQRGSEQYSKTIKSKSIVRIIEEGPAKFEINLSDYLDTGLFLDHRPLRNDFMKLCKDKTFLNLFCYTGTATVLAALSGAKSSLSIDMSRTYLDWTRRNFGLNNIDLNSHQLLRQDCLEWLSGSHQKFDIIFLDPPTFSNSKKMSTTFDLQRDHPSLIKAACKKLSKDGTLIFSNNFRKFRMNECILESYVCADVTDKTIDRDFERNKKIHKVWLIKNTEKNI